MPKAQQIDGHEAAALLADKLYDFCEKHVPEHPEIHIYIVQDLDFLLRECKRRHSIGFYRRLIVLWLQWYRGIK